MFQEKNPTTQGIHMISDTADRVTILVVDDEAGVRRLVSRIIERNGYTCFQAGCGKDALAVLEKESVDAVITDIAMPGMDGIELTETIKRRYDADVIMMTGYFKDLKYGDAIAKGASDFLQKPFEHGEFAIRLKRVLKERQMTKALNKNLEKMTVILDGVINALSYTVEARDPYTAGHQKRVTAIAAAIAKELQLSPDQVRAIEMAGMIHDLGKIAIPAEILSKPGRISETEFNLLKIHPQVGYDILKDIRFSMPIADIVLQHHERINGQGYPRSLEGSEILLEARIIAVADVVEAMSSHRPYRPALGLDKALDEIKKNKGTLYDPDVVDACCRIMEDGQMPEL